jgi:hypothetical protein
MHGEWLKLVGTEPTGQLGAMLAAGVIKMLAGGEDLDRLRSGPGSQLEQAWMQALFEEQVRGQDSDKTRSMAKGSPDSILDLDRSLL